MFSFSPVSATVSTACWAPQPWLMVVGVFVGGGIGFYTMIRTLTQPTTRDADQDDEDTHDDRGATGSRGAKPR